MPMTDGASTDLRVRGRTAQRIHQLIEEQGNAVIAVRVEANGRRPHRNLRAAACNDLSAVVGDEVLEHRTTLGKPAGGERAPNNGGRMILRKERNRGCPKQHSSQTGPRGANIAQTSTYLNATR